MPPTAFLLFLTAALSGLVSGRELIQLQVLFRHGMRAPDQSYPTNPNPDHVWREGLGRLTQHGKFQQYALGQQLREMYRDFITCSPVELEVLSSRYNRCVLSVLCHVAGLYRPNESWEFLPGMPWQPIPVLYATSGKKDPYLGKIFDCPAAVKEVKKMIKSEEGKRFLEENKDLLEFLSHHSGLSVKSWSEAATLYDILSMDKTYNLIVPDWALKHWDQIRNISETSFYFAAKLKEYQRLRGGPLLGLMRSKMQDRMKGKSRKKVILFSGHSKNLVAVLNALEVFNHREPPFCASLLLELYREPEGDHSIRLLFLNATTPEKRDQLPHPLTLPDCGEFCPFDHFSHRVDQLMPLVWEDECQVTH